LDWLALTVMDWKSSPAAPADAAHSTSRTTIETEANSFILAFPLPAFQYERKHAFRIPDKIKAPGPNVTGIIAHRSVLQPDIF
jgi:hypothetical protein